MSALDSTHRHSIVDSGLAGSVLSAGAGMRLVVAVLASAVLWLAVWWAL